jgi:Zn-dependent protease
MSGRGIFIGRVFRVPIFVDGSWFFVLIMVSWMLATGYYPSQHPGWRFWLYILMGVETTMLLFISVLVHELGHAVMANLFEIPVQRITLFIFGGVAQLGAECRTAKAEFWIALIGPIVSLAVAALCYTAMRLLPPGLPAHALFSYLAMINFLLVAFNLIPGFPLDGGRVLRAIVWGITHNMSKGTLIAVRVGQFVAISFIGLGALRALSGEWWNGLWIAFIGWFLMQASTSQLQAQTLRDVLSDYTVSQAMSRNPVIVPAHTTIKQLVDEHIVGRGRPAVIVEHAGKPQGLLTAARIRQIPRERWLQITALEAMAPEDCCTKIPPELGLWDALEKMDHSGFNQLLVGMDGHIDGLLTRGDVISFLKTVQSLGA